jgi:hypothetical protein
MNTLDQILGGMRRGSGVFFYNSDEINFQPFAFVLNVKELVGVDRIEIAAGYTLRRAQKTEIEYIKEFISKEFGRGASTTTGKPGQRHRANSPTSPRSCGVIT